MPSGSTSGDLEILDLLPDALICVDLGHQIVAWNRAAERLYGYTSQEAIGRRAPDLLATRVLEPLAEALETCEQTGRWRGTTVNRTKDGRAVTVEERWSARYDASGECSAVIVLGRELDAAPAQDDGSVAHAQRGLARVAGAVAHDLNNALAVVVSYAALAAREIEEIHEQTGEERWASLAGDVREIRCAATRGVQLSRRLVAASLAADQADGPLA